MTLLQALMIRSNSSNLLARCLPTMLKANFHSSHPTLFIKPSSNPIYKQILSNQIKISQRQAQTDATIKIVTESPFKNSSWFSKGLKVLGIGPGNIFALRRSTIFQYQACTDKLDPEKFFKHFCLPDTLYSFYLIVQLHVWMCQARSMMDGPEGRTLRNELIERMWQDFDTRMNKMEVYSSTSRKQMLEDLLFHHQGAMFSYDEGLLIDDKALASALWRTLHSKEHVDPQVLELEVRYVRTQVDHLRSIGSREWCMDGKFDWAPFPPLN